MNRSIYDVAHLAKVSISTVSRVLNQSGYVSDTTKQKVYAAVEELHYVPNVTAQNLAKAESKMIGLYFPLSFDSSSMNSSTYLLEFIQGVNEVLIEKEYHLLLINETAGMEAIAKSQAEPQYYTFGKQRRVDGIILGTEPVRCASLYQLLEIKSPLVYIGERMEGCGGLNVYAQYQAYMLEALDYLYQHNHTDVLIFTNNKTKMDNISASFHQVHHDYNGRVMELGSDLPAFIQKMESVFLQANPPSALIIEEMTKVQPAITYLTNKGFSIPGDVSVLGVEHKLHEGENCFPYITSMYVPAKEMGMEAARMLFAYLDGGLEYYAEKVLHPQIIERESVGEKAGKSSYQNHQ